MIVRPETSSDHDSIRDILIAAFANHPYSHQTEHLIVEGLRADDALTVSLVAEVDGDLVGQIAFSSVKIDGKDCGWLGLGPVAVLPSRQRQGIAAAVVYEGLTSIRSLGAKGCVLVGDPAFYRRFGFQHNSTLRMEGVPAEVLLCLPMYGQMPEGNVTQHPAFSVGRDPRQNHEQQRFRPRPHSKHRPFCRWKNPDRTRGLDAVAARRCGADSSSETGR